MNEARQRQEPRTENQPIPILPAKSDRGKSPTDTAKGQLPAQKNKASERSKKPRKKITATEKASRISGTSTVTDGEDG